MPRDAFQYVAEGRDRIVFSLQDFPWLLVKVIRPERDRVQRVLDQETRFWKSRQPQGMPVIRILGQFQTVLGDAQITEAVQR